METIEFEGCEQLNFSDDYKKSCRLQQLGSGHLFWMRNKIWGDPRMVQFCKLRGRLNHPESCLKKENAVCSEYKEFMHRIEVDQKELDS